MLIEYSTATPKNNKIAWINIVLQHTSKIDEYSASIIDNATINEFTINLLRKTIYPVKFLHVLLSPM